MKKLLVLTAVLMLTASAVGCRCCDWLCRGPAPNPCPPVPVCANPCVPACDPCASGAGIAPGPAPYVTIPTQ